MGGLFGGVSGGFREYWGVLFGGVSGGFRGFLGGVLGLRVPRCDIAARNPQQTKPTPPPPNKEAPSRLQQKSTPPPYPQQKGTARRRSKHSCLGAANLPRIAHLAAAGKRLQTN